MSLSVSSISGKEVPSIALYLTPYSLWSMPLIPPFPSLVQSTIGQLVITSQPSMSGVQSVIGPNPTANLRSGFPPSFATPVRSIVMSSTGYPFGWNWNSGVSAQIVNPIRSVTPSSVLPYRGGINVPGSLPFRGGTNPLGSYPFPEGGHVYSGLPFPRNVNIPSSYPFPEDSYPPSNV